MLVLDDVKEIVCYNVRIAVVRTTVTGIFLMLQHVVDSISYQTDFSF
jgi:hypothetical protein